MSDPLDILAEAAAWRIALAEADQESSVAFEAWLAADPRHAAAWKQVQVPWDHVGLHATAPEAMAVREEALQRARRQQRRRFGGARPVARPLAWAGLAAAVVLAVGVAWQATAPATYRTDLGERRVVTLQDGSKVVLDSGALLKVKLERRARRLELVRGQARFDVAHDASRPFSVRARDQVVVATGTSFNVDLLNSRVLVTLIEGRVTVLKQDEAGVVLARLTPGQQLAVADGPGAASQAPAVRPANLERATAWESGQLIFDNEPLAAVAERIGRYGETRLEVEGPAAHLKVSGIFNAGDTTSFLEAVEHGLPVRAEARADGRIIIRKVGAED